VVIESVRRAEEGDAGALPRIKKLKSLPDAAEKFGGNIATRVTDVLLASFANSNLYLREAVMMRKAALRSELEGDWGNCGWIPQCLTLCGLKPSK
jgi:hypothetical protein